VELHLLVGQLPTVCVELQLLLVQLSIFAVKFQPLMAQKPTLCEFVTSSCRIVQSLCETAAYNSPVVHCLCRYAAGVSCPFVPRCADRYSLPKAEQCSDNCEAASLLSVSILFEGKCHFHRQGYKVRQGPRTLTDLD